MNIMQMSFSAAILIIAVVILRALTLYKLPKKTFLVLWGVVICRLLIPFYIPFRLSFYTGLEMLRRAITETMRFTAPAIFGTPPITTDTPNMSAVDIGKLAESGTSKILVSISPLTIIWLIGIGVCAIFFIVIYIKCRREFETALPVENDFITLWQQKHPAWLPVQIRQSDRINAPLTYGVFRPMVLLPKATDWTDETKLQYIMTHEYVHIKRFDALTKLLLTAALCIHWFNPFVWIMYILANRDIELSCDETVVKTFGEPMKSGYALTLIGLEEKKSRLTPLFNNFSKNAIEERITAIMKIKKFSIPIIIVAVLLVVGVTVVFLTSNAKTDTSPSPDVAASVDVTGNIDEVSDLGNNTDLDWVWPVEGCDTVVSLYGKRIHPITGINKFHDHIDIAGDGVEGADVYASLAGTVSEAGFDAEQGNYIVIDHDNGIETFYRHLDKLQFSAGDPVAAGDTIGTVGSTGNVTGPHLAFGVFVDGMAVNPLEYLKIKS